MNSSAFARQRSCESDGKLSQIPSNPSRSESCCSSSLSEARAIRLAVPSDARESAVRRKASSDFQATTEARVPTSITMIAGHTSRPSALKGNPRGASRSRGLLRLSDRDPAGVGSGFGVFGSVMEIQSILEAAGGPEATRMEAMPLTGRRRGAHGRRADGDVGATFGPLAGWVVPRSGGFEDPGGL